MNNKPVAWMSNGSFEISTMQSDKFSIPLYTHPVKEQDTDCQYCKQGCIRCDARKQLTDEEICNLWVEHGYGQPLSNIAFEFARAILKKAQEK